MPQPKRLGLDATCKICPQQPTTSESRPLWKSFKHNSDRVVDSEGFKRRAAALCLRRGQKSIEILLINGGTEGEWVVPGGGLENAESPLETAVRELEEEAGVKGDVLGTIGVLEVSATKSEAYIFKENLKNRRSSLVVISPKEELAQWEEGVLGRQRRWVSVDEAIAVVKECQRPMLEALSIR